MDKIKEECITLIENYYCQRLTELVDLKMYDEAHTLSLRNFHGDDESYQWFFIKILEVDNKRMTTVNFPTLSRFKDL